MKMSDKPSEKIRPHKAASWIGGLMSTVALVKTYQSHGNIVFAVATAALTGAIIYSIVYGFEYLRLIIARRKSDNREDKA